MEEHPAPARRCTPSAVEIVEAALALLMGAAVGFTGMSLVVGAIFTIGLAVYLLVGNNTVRLLVVSALLGLHAGYLAVTQGTKLVLPFIDIERGPVGASISPDVPQILLAYEVYRRCSSQGQNNYKPRRDLTPPGTQARGAAVV